MESSETRRKRLPRDERERLILDEAVKFFAEVGFEGQTRALAVRLGVTQPLLYRYFPDKETLIERVFDEVYLKRWRPEWGLVIASRDRPLVERLVTFYKLYRQAIFKPEWVRLFMFAGLKGENINAPYLEIVRSHVLEPIGRELRHEHGLPSVETLPLDEMEINLLWGLHGSIFHIAMRKWIYMLPAPEDMDALIETTVRAFFLGCGEACRQLVAARA